MRGELDDALARIARMEELQRRLAADTANETTPAEATRETWPPTPEPGHDDYSSSADPYLADPEQDEYPPAATAHEMWQSPVVPARPEWSAGTDADRIPTVESPLDDLVEAVGRVVERHPQLAVSLWADDGSGETAVRVEWANGTVSVTADEEQLPLPSAGAPPTWPMPTQPPQPWAGPSEPSADSAARLAELIRQNPSLLRAPTDDDR